MPRDLIGRINWDLIEPEFASKVFDVLAACRKRGKDYYVISGYRSPEEQAKLYAQGRTAPGPIVTKAQFSAHQLGLAVDVCLDANLDRAGLQPSWDIEGYRMFAEEAKKAGLDSGWYWKFRDAPHVQPKGLKLGDLRDILDLGGGLGPVWAYVRSLP